MFFHLKTVAEMLLKVQIKKIAYTLTLADAKLSFILIDSTLHLKLTMLKWKTLNEKTDEIFILKLS